MLRRVPAEVLTRAILAHAVDDEDLEPVLRIVTREDGVEASPEVALLIATRHDNGDERARGGHGRLPASATGWRVGAGIAATGRTKSPTIAPRRPSSNGDALTNRSYSTPRI